MSSIIITEEMMERWQQKKNELEQKLEAVQQKLQAVSLIQEETYQPKEAREEREITVKGIARLRPAEAIKDTLEGNEKRLRAGDILERLTEAGYPKKKWGKENAYFYSVLKRLVDQEKIVKIENKYTALKEPVLKTPPQGRMKKNLPKGILDFRGYLSTIGSEEGAKTCSNERRL